MLELFNRYCHGLVVTPLLAALARLGCLDRIAQSPEFTASMLAMPGQLAEDGLELALRMLACLGWIDSVTEGVFRPTVVLRWRQGIPQGIEALYRFPFGVEPDAGVSGAQEAFLGKWLACSERRWDDAGPYADYYDGALFLPMLVALRQARAFALMPAVDDAAAVLSFREETVISRGLERFLVSKRWGQPDEGGMRLSRAGKFMIERADLAATAVSYRPMLADVGQRLLVGNAGDNPLRGRIAMVDRGLNIRGSGFQHRKYFEAVVEMVMPLFDHNDFEAQPGCIADVGCGDGTLLRMLYEAIVSRSARGRVLAAHPLMLLAIDAEEVSLAAAGQMLAGLPHRLLCGDVGEPERLVAQLISAGIDPQRTLHVRSFVDHDREGLSSDSSGDGGEGEGEGIPPGDQVYLDADGNRIPSMRVIRETVRHLRRWSRVLGGHGAIIAEVHALSVAKTLRFSDESESLHFDLYHALSRQYPIEAPAFLACAAQAGLFTSAKAFHRFPRRLDYVRITLAHWFREPYTIVREDARAIGGDTLAVRWSAGSGVIDGDAAFVLRDEEGVTLSVLTFCGEKAGVLRLCALGAVTPMPVPAVMRLLDYVELYADCAGLEISATDLDACRSASAGTQFSVDAAPQDIARQVMAAVPNAEAGADVIDALRAEETKAESELLAFASAWVLAGFRAHGAFADGGPQRLERVEAILGVVPKYRRYFAALLRMLAAQGLLRNVDDGFEVTGVLAYAGTHAELDAFFADFARRYSQAGAIAGLCRFALEQYHQILRGEVDVADVLLTPERIDAFGALFAGTPETDRLNAIAAELSAAAVALMASTEKAVRPLRILEVGGGTGSFSEKTLSALAMSGARIEYVFSDVGPIFVGRAQRRFGAKYPWLRCQAFDIDQDPVAQGIEPYSFDLVLAGDSLHVTADVVRTLRAARRLLRPNGLLIASEFTAPRETLMFCGKLLHGAWSFIDPQRRLPDDCLLSIEQWRESMIAAGLVCVGVYPPRGEGGTACAQAVMLASVATKTKDADAMDADGKSTGMRQRCTAELEQEVLGLLGAARSAAYAPTRPLMEIGLDSMELTELRRRISERYGISLSSAFLFEHETVAAIASWLTQVRVAPPVAMRDQERMSRPGAPGAMSRANGLTDGLTDGSTDDLAVVGIACRLPGGVDSPSALWTLLETGASGITSLPDGRWQWPAHIDPSGEHVGIDRGGFLSDIDCFDARFFRISPKEAELMDPQQRLLLELTHSAIEDAGHRPSALIGESTGVFVGACHYDYRDLLSGREDLAAAYIGSGSAPSLLANRVSYQFGFSGPSLTVDTACSSSLTALHAAAEAIRNGECARALVGAVNLMCSPVNSVAYYSAGMLSRSGNCRPFDAAADGYARGEGGVMLLLKPLSAAVDDGDDIYGLVKAVAVGHGGQAASLTAPRPDAQARTIGRACRLAGIGAHTLGYLEAHGSGTPLGDPIEIAGILEAFRGSYSAAGLAWPDRPHCLIGSVKSNLGHLEAAAGLAGVAKVLLSMRHGIIPRTLHFGELNRDIALEGTPLAVADQNKPWTRMTAPQGAPLPLRAGVSSFGFGGTCAHAILEEHRSSVRAPEREEHRLRLFLLSAKSRAQLATSAQRLAVWMEDNVGGFAMDDLAGTLHLGRDVHECRAAFIAGAPGELVAELKRFAQCGEAVERSLFVSDPDGGVSGGTRSQEAWPADMQEVDALRAQAMAWIGGAEIASQAVGGSRPRRLHLPAYPFERRRYWVRGDRDSDEESQVVPASDATTAAAFATTRRELLVSDAQPSASTEAMVEPPRLWCRAWRAVPVGSVAAAPHWARHVVMLAGDAAAIREELQTRLSSARVIAGDGAEHDHAWRYIATADSVFATVKGLIAAAPKTPLLFQLVVAGRADVCWAEGFAAFLRAVRAEYPAFCGQTLVFDHIESTAGLVERLHAAAAAPAEAEVSYAGGERRLPYWVEAEVEVDTPPWRDGGVYLIAGAGKLGRRIAAAIAKQTRGAHVLLLGRSAATAQTDAMLSALRARGLDADYAAVDLTDRGPVVAAVSKFRAERGAIHGVVHAAGRDDGHYLLRLDKASYAAALATKAAGVLHLDEATAADKLDLFVSISSLAATLAEPGRTAAAAAEGFLHGFASYRNTKVVAGERYGRTVSLAWAPYDDDAPPDDIDAGLSLWPSRAERVVALEPRHKDAMGAASAVTGATTPAGKNGIEIEKALQRELAVLLARLLHFDAAEIRAEAAFRDFGMESVALTDFTGLLNETYGLSLVPTVLFEYHTISRLAAHLVTRGVEAVRQGQAAPASPIAEPRQRRELGPDRLQEEKPGAAKRDDDVDMDVTAGEAMSSEAIAIVGVSCRLPMAHNLKEFWALLAEGRSAIGEIPPERWDWRAIYGDAETEPNRTAIKWGAFIDGVDEFDPLFFNISPQEARLMDPEHRLLLMHAWNAIEDAGYAADAFAGSDTGVFIGMGWSDYSSVVARAGETIEAYTATGTVASVGPNRVSFFLDLHGPSTPIETACSSSLVAIHRAMQSIRAGECAQALAGGINLLLTPQLHISFSKAGMLSRDGRCHTFSDRANGYVRGEGVGVLLLKPQQRAIVDGDAIYALLRGSAENHGGRANTLTAPNPNAQAELIKRAYLRAGVDPASVGYIEAHGTGTPLGDPIEINGLKNAFAALADVYASRPAPGGCGLGSVKTNVGHLEVAAGIAGVLKILLQFRHGRLAASLNCENINPYVELDGSPFRIVRENCVWPEPRDADGRRLPRRAGVSSFGFGGVNAHLLLEEYLPAATTGPRAGAGPELIVLSAKNEARLRERASGLLAALDRGEFADADLADIAYTLQVGRVAMDERLCFVAATLEEVCAALRGFLDGRTSQPPVRRGRAEPGGTSSLGLIAMSEEMLEVVARWLQDGRLEKISELWASGFKPDWTLLKRSGACRRVHLPGYPFARERCWVKTAATPLSVAVPTPTHDAGMPARVGPAVSVQDSAQSFAKAFSGSEFFLAGHVLGGQSILPGVAYLDIVREAMRFLPAAGAENASSPVLRFSDVLWLRPFVAGPGVRDLTIHADGAGLAEAGVDFEARSSESAANDPIVHAQGRVALFEAPPPPALDLVGVRARCRSAAWSADACYDAFAAAQFDYGRDYRALVSVEVGHDELLATLELSSTLKTGADAYVLHPALSDAAVQAAIIGFALGEAEDGAAPAVGVPFELARAEIIRACPAQMYAAVRRVGVSPTTHRFDIDLCDVEGRVCARFVGLAVRIVRSGRFDAVAQARSRIIPAGASLSAPEWREVAASPAKDAPAVGRTLLLAAPASTAMLAGALAQSGTSELVLTLDPAMDIDSMRREIAAKGPFAHVLCAVPASGLTADGADEARQQCGPATRMFSLIKALLAEGYDAAPLTWTVLTQSARSVVAGDAADPAQAAVHGVVATMAREYPEWNVRVADLDDAIAADGPILAEILNWPRSAAARIRARRGGLWYEQCLAALPEGRVAEPPYRHRGVYVVIGGAGGLGGVWSEHIIRRAQAQVVWIGRRQTDASIAERIARLRSLGPVPHYISADAADAGQLQAACDEVKRKFGRIDGVVVAAMALQDRSLATMSEHEFRAGLVPKIDVGVSVRQVFRDAGLDFVLFFSSVNALVHPPGQCNYVAGCLYQDELAQRMNLGVDRHAFAINWGYWGDVGAVASDEYRRRMAETGFDSLQATPAMAALDTVLGGDRTQALYTRMLYSYDLDGPADQRRPSGAADPAGDEAPMSVAEMLDGSAEVALARLEAHVRNSVAATLGIAPQVFDTSARKFGDTLLGEYGMDSLMAATFRGRLRRELAVDIPVHAIIGEKVGAIVAAIYEQLQVQRLSAAVESESAEEMETFML